MKKTKLYQKIICFSVLVLILIVLFNASNRVEAKIANSGHDITSRDSIKNRATGLEGKGGICSFCHIPHSAQGSRLWPYVPSNEYVNNIGEIGLLCYTKCHNPTFPNDDDYIPKIADTIANPEFVLDGTHPLIDNDSAPNTNQSLSGWPHTDGKRLECTSCHDVHQQEKGVNSKSYGSKKGNFLRAPIFDTTYFNRSFRPKKKESEFETVYVDEAGYGLPKLFCSYCHQERAYESTGYGTHPINKSGAENEEGHFIRKAGNGVFTDSTIFAVAETTRIKAYDPENPTGGHLSYYESGTVICNTCHRAHAAAPGGSLLVVDNRTTIGSRYGSNALCEACHDKNPSLGDPTDKHFAHPVDSTNTMDLISSRGHKLYIDIPEGWKTLDTTNRKGIVCLTCHKVHQAKKNSKMLNVIIDKNTKAEVEKGDNRICDDCHSPNPIKPTLMEANAGNISDSTNPLAKGEYGPETHPVHVPLNVTDDKTVKWPNNDWLRLFNTEGKVFNTTLVTINNGLIYCETCHNVHKGYSKSLVEYPGDNYSEICVGCHTDYKKLNKGKSWVGGRYLKSKFIDTNNNDRQNYLESNLTGGYYSLVSYINDTTVFGANPSSYIIEYDTAMYVNTINTNSSEVYKKYNYKERKVTDRLGTHPSGLRIDEKYYGSTECGGSGFMFKATYEKSGDESGWDDKYPTELDAIKYFSRQKSYWGTNESTIICQSCHTPHGAAKGLVERNTGADSTDIASADITPNGALLLGNNIDSNLCTACHRGLMDKNNIVQHIIPHPLSIEICNDDTYRKLQGQDKDGNIINRRDCQLENSKNCDNILENVATRAIPANYPKPAGGYTQLNEKLSGTYESSTQKLVCDSCHAPHAAETSSGSRILEAGLPVDSSNFDKNLNVDNNTKNGGKRYQKDKNKYNDSKFCSQCHKK